MFNIFKSELRLITPKKFGFSSSNDKTETELQTITASVAKQDTEFSSLKRSYADLRTRIILNYFWLLIPISIELLIFNLFNLCSMIRNLPSNTK